MLARERRTQLAFQLMLDFAQRTGLTSERKPQRYLWTDAFAVCNALGLARQTSETPYTDLACEWIDQVHHVLGRHRADDSRDGWISGLPESEGEAHPARGGVRIGKPLPERAKNAPLDERLEWERDGQYFHYLTRWMHALDQTARATREPRFNLWARELAEAAHRAFVYEASGRAGKRMAWKRSIDLSRPLVSAMGHHDPLDGLVTCAQLRASATLLGTLHDGPNLETAMGDFGAMVEGTDWVTADPLGLGGLLVDARRISWLMERGTFAKAKLLDIVLAAAATGLKQYIGQGDLQCPAGERLAFRELGLGIGLHAVGLIDRGSAARVTALEPYVALGSAIESFWVEPEHRLTQTWLEHRDINDVMLATRLIPDGYLLMDGLGEAVS